jgi:hypothetical protein
VLAVSAVPEFTRTSRSVSANEMPVEFRSALERHSELVGIDPEALGDVRAAAITVSTPHKSGFLRRRREYTTWIAVTAGGLVVVSDASGDPVASVYRLDGIEVRPFASPLVEDEGLDVVAMPVGGSERSTVFVPLADGPAREAIVAALG